MTEARHETVIDQLPIAQQCTGADPACLRLEEAHAQLRHSELLALRDMLAPFDLLEPIGEQRLGAALSPIFARLYSPAAVLVAVVGAPGTADFTNCRHYQVPPIRFALETLTLYLARRSSAASRRWTAIGIRVLSDRPCNAVCTGGSR